MLSTLALLAWLLTTVWLTLRCCWYDVSPECGNARRDRWVSGGLTLCLGLLKQRRLSTGGARLRCAGLVHLAQGVARLISLRHVILTLLRRGAALAVCIAELILLCVVSLILWGLNG